MNQSIKLPSNYGLHDQVDDAHIRPIEPGDLDLILRRFLRAFVDLSVTTKAVILKTWDVSFNNLLNIVSVHAQ